VALVHVRDTARVGIRSGNTEQALRNSYFGQDVAMSRIRMSVIAALWLVAARHRRPGQLPGSANHGDILRYFQTWNSSLVNMGVMLSMVLACGLNIWLMLPCELPRLQIYY
jgi:hypothetical protein